MRVKILKALTCFRCGGNCYSVTHSGEKGATDRQEVFWKCSECGRQFITNENVSEITVIVDQLPSSQYFVEHEILED